MAGGDVAAMSADPTNVADQLISAMHGGLQLLANGQAPLVASLQGAMAGEAVSLALAADFAVAAEDVRFNMAYANIGASCALGASWSLPRVVGLRRPVWRTCLPDSRMSARSLRISANVTACFGGL